MLLRASVFYGVLSLVVSVPLVVFAPEVVALVPYLKGPAEGGAVVLLRYAAVAFVLTNATLVLDGLLRGIGRVAASYKAQTAGWILLAPTIAVGVLAGWGVHGPGVAWLVTYAVQIALLGWRSVVEMRKLPLGKKEPPTIWEMASLGGRWQVSSWADFATFQLPRLVGGVALSSSALVSIDLAMRFGQLAVAPLLALYPVVLPAATATFVRGGRSALARQITSWYVPGVALTVLAAAVLAPLAAPVIAAWVGRAVGASEGWVAVLVLLGVLAHASTGLLSSALLAIGEIRAVVVYKTQPQLVLALALMTLGAFLGETFLAAGVFVALAVPAVRFNQRSASQLTMSTLSASGLVWRRLVLLALGSAAALGILVAVLNAAAASWLTAAVGTLVGAVLFFLTARAYGLDLRIAWTSLARFIASSRAQPEGTPRAKAAAS